MSARILLVTLAVCLGTAAPVAAASGRPGGLCSGPPVSAQSQYCENIPSASGGRGPQIGSPGGGPGSVESTLPPGALRAIAGSDQLSPRRRLLALPPRISASTAAPDSLGGANADVGSLVLPLVLALLAVVLGMTLGAARRRRQRTARAV